MASNYPDGLDDFAEIPPLAKMNEVFGGRGQRAHMNDTGDAIEAIQAELGANPSGSEATVKDRLDELDSDLAGKADTTDVTDGLAGKANNSHTHPQSDVTGLVAGLAAKAPVEADLRVPMPAVGEYSANGVFCGQNTTTNSTVNTQRFYTSSVDHAVTTDLIAFYTSSTNATIKIGIYAAGPNGALIAGTGDIVITSSGWKSINLVSAAVIPVNHVVGVLLKAGSFTCIGTGSGRPAATSAGILTVGPTVRSGLSDVSTQGTSTTAAMASVSPLLTFRRSA